MKLSLALPTLAIFLTGLQVIVADLLIAVATDNCEVSVITGNSTFCCDGICIDKTEIGSPGVCLDWDDECQVAPKCKNSQVPSAKNQTPIDSGDGCCYVCGLNPQGCQWQRFQWTYSCCDCPAGYVAGSGGECGTFIGGCYACDGEGEVLTKNGTQFECLSSGGSSSTSKPSTILGSTASSVGAQSTSPLVANPTAGATSNSDNNGTTITQSTSKNGLSTGAKVGIGVGVPLAVAALVGLLICLWKTGALSAIIGSTSAGAAGGGAAGTSTVGATQAMQTSSASKPLLMSGNSPDPAVFGAIAGAAAATTAANMAANQANTTNIANTANTANPTIDPTHASNAAGSPSDPTATIGSNVAAPSPGDAGMSSVGAAPSGPSASVGATAASPSGPETLSNIGQTGSAATGHQSGGFFTVLGGLRRKKSKEDEKNKRPLLATSGSSEQPLVGELEGGRNRFGPGDGKHESAGQEIRGHEMSGGQYMGHEVGGTQIHEVDESTVSEVDSTPRHELK